jgi:hypothetical protein
VRQGTADAVILCTQPVPDRSAGEMDISVKVVDSQTGDVFRIYPACTSSEALGPITVEFENLGGGEWKVSCGSDFITQTASLVAPDTVQLQVCADHSVGMIKAGLASPSGADDAYLWLDDTDAGTGRYAAIGHDNGTSPNNNGVIFDDFQIAELRTETIFCDDCFCWCLGKVPKKTLLISVIDPVNRAQCLIDLFGTLEWEWNSGAPRWYGEIDVPAWGGGSSETMTFDVRCAQSGDDDPEWPGKNFTLDFGTRCCDANSNGCGTYQPIADKSSCNSFQLKFGPFVLTSGDLNCRACWQPNTPVDPGTLMNDCMNDDPAKNDPNCEGQYYLLLTEAP